MEMPVQKTSEIYTVLYIQNFHGNRMYKISCQLQNLSIHSYSLILFEDIIRKSCDTQGA